jgi:hypothetical protein
MPLCHPSRGALIYLTITGGLRFRSDLRLRSVNPNGFKLPNLGILISLVCGSLFFGKSVNLFFKFFRALICDSLRQCATPCDITTSPGSLRGRLTEIPC